MPRYKLTKETTAILLAEYVKGKTTEAAAATVGISKTQAKRVINAAGIMRSRKVPAEVKAEIMRLYLEEKLSPREIGPRFGMTTEAIGTHIDNSGKRRSGSEAQCIVAIKREHKKGRGGWWQSVKTGKWEHGMSIMELLRMQQLDSDDSVRAWTREVPNIEYEPGKRYVPDLLVHYHDGTVCIEEVKPSSQYKYEENIAKWCIARILFAAKGIGFSVVSEGSLGGEKAIRAFNLDGIQRIDPEEKRARQLKYWSDYHRNRKLKRKAANGNNSATQAAA
jgi:hypothetical protein